MSNLTPIAKLGAPAPPPPRALSRRQKAAIVVRLLLNEGADVALRDLPEDLQADLTQQMGEMRYVDRATLAQVIGEFADELDAIGLSFPRGIAGALSMLDGQISPQTAARLRKEAGVRQIGDPWQRLRGLEVKDLLPIIENEATEVSAVMLSKLDVAKAAEILGQLPGEKARRITYAVSQTSAVTPDAVDRIGLSLASQLDDKPLAAFEDGPVERIGAILNFSPAGTRDDVLVGLGETDAEFADQVRKAIFTFANIPARIETRDIPKILREVEQETLITALAAATAEDDAAAAEYILSNISNRMAESLREEIGEAGKIKQKLGEEAMNMVIAAIRELESQGELTLIVEEEDDDE